jgi:hypothetical protein
VGAFGEPVSKMRSMYHFIVGLMHVSTTDGVNPRTFAIDSSLRTCEEVSAFLSCKGPSWHRFDTPGDEEEVGW